MEAGERIYRRHMMPEEINRVLTDHAAALCLTATARAQSYLLQEGMCPDRVRFVGDPMYDLFKWAQVRLEGKRAYCTVIGLPKGGYHLATIHRVENTADRSLTLSLLETLDASTKPVVLPVHPRLRNLLKKWGWVPQNSLRLIDPLGYFDFVNLLMTCDICITDSGGVPREAFFARRPCIIPMASSYWTELVEAGWEIVTGSDHQRLAEVLKTFRPPSTIPENIFGNGDSASQIIQCVADVAKHRPLERIWRPYERPNASYLNRIRVYPRTSP
jgi:UDP-GlcNAc3NAcA epimerase